MNKIWFSHFGRLSFLKSQFRCALFGVVGFSVFYYLSNHVLIFCHPTTRALQHEMFLNCFIKRRCSTSKPRFRSLNDFNREFDTCSDYPQMSKVLTNL